MFESFVPSDASETETVRLPAVLKATLNTPVPDASGPLDGRIAFESDEVKLTESFAAAIRFQLASTALTITLNAVPAV